MQEIVVIGGGVAGVATALALSDRGAAVTVVEASRPGAGATGASAGMLAAQYEARAAGPYFELCLESRRRYGEFVERLERLTGRSLEVSWDGMLVANWSRSEQEAAEDSAGWQREAGCRAEVIAVKEAQRLQPEVADEAQSYLWLAEEGQVDSQALALALADALAGDGVRLICGNAVAEIRSEGGRVTGVRMADGRGLEADGAVLAAGAWSGAVEGLPRHLPVRPVRGQMVRYPAGLVDLQPIVSSHEGRYLVPRSDGTILCGSTMEEVGFDQSITEDGLRTVQEGAGRLVPALSGQKASERWSGLRPLAADALPVIGPDPELEGLVYATGYGRDGILLAPLAGSMAADLALGSEPDWDWHLYRPERFGP